MEDYRQINPIYRFSYSGEHFYEIIIDASHSVYFSLSARESAKLRSIDMVEYHLIKREVMYSNMETEVPNKIPAEQPSV